MPFRHRFDQTNPATWPRRFGQGLEIRRTAGQAKSAADALVEDLRRGSIASAEAYGRVQADHVRLWPPKLSRRFAVEATKVGRRAFGDKKVLGRQRIYFRQVLVECSGTDGKNLVGGSVKKRIKVAVTGAAGQIGYALLFRIASGQMFGPETELEFQLLELEQALPALQGVIMELDDCAFPLLKSVRYTSDVNEAMSGVNWAVLVGAIPRKAGMERSDLLRMNGQIFIGQGRAINDHAAGDVRVFVVGNPCNTNCLIAMNNAPKVPRDRFFAMTMLDELRARKHLAKKAGVDVSEVSQLAVWGNHSTTQHPRFLARENRRTARRRSHRRSRLARRRIHLDRSEPRRRSHQGARRLVGGLRGQRGHRRRLQSGPRHAAGRILLGRTLLQRRVRGRSRPDLFVPFPHRRRRFANRRRARPRRVQYAKAARDARGAAQGAGCGQGTWVGAGLTDSPLRQAKAYGT